MDVLTKIKNYQFKNYQSSSHSIYHRLPLNRRSSVFILLFHHNDDLKVLLSQRSSKLRSFPGHVSLPGGRADTPLEDEWMTSRREMEEELGIPRSNDGLGLLGCEIEKINIMPSYLSRTLSCVRPCIGYLRTFEGFQGLDLKLNPGETSCVFSVSLKDFTWPEKMISEISIDKSTLIERDFKPVKWGGIPWKLRSYMVSRDDDVDWISNVIDLSEESESDMELDPNYKTPQPNEKKSEKLSKKERLQQWGRLGSSKSDAGKIFDVWGLTANIIHDLAVVAYSEPKGEMGEEELIYSLFKNNYMKERNETEKQLISDEIGFNDLLSRQEFNDLKRIYKI
ncbi:peroxisomal coenzyme A diphosphatase 1, peroxisomal [[Candida] jaroonii]|uniref:Peroxisomal coenzyme A diphosphatase 1, peroxisomal n=1 Tax=[Candida] jaroonii TaxID=467808 RepID=A0ACA9YBP2_9ASCO|nr:peroxisomal coenzyme A diphosphatase 1, peroxisomal [[Candida] jaroonii]